MNATVSLIYRQFFRKRLEKKRVIERIKPKKLNFEDSFKARAFNRIFQENMNIVLNLEHIREKLDFHPVHVTKVSQKI